MEPPQLDRWGGFFDAMLSPSYEARGWDLETGKPSREKLTQLGLLNVGEDLWG
jgi:aldehyde:ferredoxin oxidoreductase